MPKQVEYKDPQGFLYAVLIPDNAADSQAKFGIRVGPPSLAKLRLPKEVERRLNNALYYRRIFTASDARLHKQDVLSAWQSVLSVDVGQIVDLYQNGAET